MSKVRKILAILENLAFFRILHGAHSLLGTTILFLPRLKYLRILYGTGTKGWRSDTG